MRAVFFGTPAAALPSLERLVEIADVPAVVTRPDKPRGRSGRPRPSPVKERALELDLAVWQPARAGEIRGRLAALRPDVAVVVAYGRILPGELLEVPAAGFVNVHFSLLPRWRGAAPVQAAILAGDPTTGVSIMVLDEGLDTGPVIDRAETSIGSDETTGELETRLAQLGAERLAAVLPGYTAGDIDPIAQPEEGVTVAGKVSTEDARLAPDQAAAHVLRAIRAFNPRPGAWALVDGERIKLWRAAPAEAVSQLEPGELALDGDRLLLGTADQAVQVVEVQPASGRRMSGEAWARGHWRSGVRLRAPELEPG